MYRENFIDALRSDVVEMVANSLTPKAIRYGYSDVPLETNIKWRPLVLLLGNYSSGKSTLINEFLGALIQKTGQAPTDDSFTIITYDDEEPPGAEIRVTEERDGKVLLNNPEYPFEILKKHGQRFAAHFRLKKVNSPFLKDLAIIDTPGMLDSITERDRGYNYQHVIGDLAQIVDLILVLFDPHKAGTVREAHQSLRETLPSRIFEDRILFVLNRIDECTSLIDLLRVYGTLCWNLSQITGRKDIPLIHLTYSPHATAGNPTAKNSDEGYLSFLDNQREELRKAILQAPRHRLDHLASFVETHAERLGHLLEALSMYAKRRRIFKGKYAILGFFVSLILGGAAGIALMSMGGPIGSNQMLLIAIGALVTIISVTAWQTFLKKIFMERFHRKAIDLIDDLTPLFNQTRQDSWENVREFVRKYLINSQGDFSYKEVRREYLEVLRIHEEGTREIREALNELASLKEGEVPEWMRAESKETEEAVQTQEKV